MKPSPPSSRSGLTASRFQCAKTAWRYRSPSRSSRSCSVASRKRSSSRKLTAQRTIDMHAKESHRPSSARARSKSGRRKGGWMRLFQKKSKKRTAKNENSDQAQAILHAGVDVEVAALKDDQHQHQNATVAGSSAGELAGQRESSSKILERKGKRSLTWSAGSAPGTVAVEICEPRASEETEVRQATARECEHSSPQPSREAPTAAAERRRMSPRSAWRRRSPSGSSRSCCPAGRDPSRHKQRGVKHTALLAKLWNGQDAGPQHPKESSRSTSARRKSKKGRSTMWKVAKAWWKPSMGQLPASSSAGLASGMQVRTPF